MHVRRLLPAWVETELQCARYELRELQKHDTVQKRLEQQRRRKLLDREVAAYAADHREAVAS